MRSVAYVLNDGQGWLTVNDQTMYQGVLRDDERRRAKYMKRKEEREASLRKREVYEAAQTVRPSG